MPRILIVATRPGVHAAGTTDPLTVEVVTLSDVDGIYALRCAGDGLDECPGECFGDPEGGDTWTDFEGCIQEGEAHVEAHERRVCAVCAGQMRFEYGHAGPGGEFAQTATCTSCGATEVRL